VDEVAVFRGAPEERAGDEGTGRDDGEAFPACVIEGGAGEQIGQATAAERRGDKDVLDVHNLPVRFIEQLRPLAPGPVPAPGGEIELVLLRVVQGVHETILAAGVRGASDARLN
jgi:hypothetical protein